MPEEVKEERWHRFMAAQQSISAAKLQKRVGRTLRVLVDEVGGSKAIARSSADAPEIDGLVHVNLGKSKAAPGDFLDV